MYLFLHLSVEGWLDCLCFLSKVNDGGWTRMGMSLLFSVKIDPSQLSSGSGLEREPLRGSSWRTQAPLPWLKARPSLSHPGFEGCSVGTLALILRPAGAWSSLNLGSHCLLIYQCEQEHILPWTLLQSCRFWNKITHSKSQRNVFSSLSFCMCSMFCLFFLFFSPFFTSLLGFG